MKIIVQSDFCRKKNCPTLYRDEKGSYFIQGYIVENPQSKLANLPEGESIVQIDASLLEQIKKLGDSMI